jgi:DNA processing protein
VIEADQESGALITARFALEQNREVLAVPGSIYSPASRGANSLIQAGAKLVTRVEDVLEELNVTAVSQPFAPAQLTLDVTPEQSRILHHLTRQPVHIDDLRQRTGMEMPALSSTLALLELNGLAKQVGAMHFVLARETQAEYSVETR